MKKSRAKYMREWRARKQQEAVNQYMAVWGPIGAELRVLENGSDLPRSRKFLELLKKRLVFKPYINQCSS